MENPNQHIEEFLNYYYYFEKAPKYAVLLKGKWGTGKTWFVEKTLADLKSNGGKYLYVSLYGATCIDDIENEFFKQLHPFLSSKSMALTSKIAKGLLRATLKIDLDNNGIDDGNISPQIPNIHLPEYLTNTDGFVLIFDDLERSSISIESILGYINSFVEHQEHKVVIIANEEEILSKEQGNENAKNTYNRIKEKLIGKTFEIEPDIKGALEEFTNDIHAKETKAFYKNNIESITELYELSLYKNLRHLKQSLWDFERLIEHLPKKAIEKHELIKKLFKIFIIFSFEIKSGSISAKDINNFRRGYYSSLSNTEQVKNHFEEISKKYGDIFVYDLILEESTWADIFDRGLISKDSIDKSLQKSEYFKSENTPSWVRLWHASELNDDDFEKYLALVTSEFEGQKINETGIIKHVVGILLWLSDINLYKKPKEEILEFSKALIDKIKEKGELVALPEDIHNFRSDESWSGLGFQSRELHEFQAFCQYVRAKEEEVRVEQYPVIVRDLIENIKSDPHLFNIKVARVNHVECLHYKSPIFQNESISPKEFVDILVSATAEQKRLVSYTFSERYKNKVFNSTLTLELPWLQEVISLLSDEALKRKGKMSGYQIERMIDPYFNEAINNLRTLK